VTKAPHTLRGAAAIVGIGLAGCGDAPGFSHLELLAQAVDAALADAGLTLRDIDGLFTATLTNFFPALTVAEYLGIRPAVVDGTNVGGASFLQHAISAAMALRLGLCKVAVICYGSNQRSAAGRLVTLSQADQPPYEAPYKPRYPIVAYALAASRHMHLYGTTPEQLAEVAVAARAWARLNPMAYMRAPLTIDEVRTSRMVCDPLTVRDCCLVTDGAGAIVMVAADRARDAHKPPAYFLGGAHATWNRQVSSMPDITATAAQESGARAFAMAGLSPADVDQAQLYDAFTITPILFLEDLGFCPKGEGGRFVEGGRIAPGGALPVNTNGGGLSFCHPGMYGIFTLIEAAAQIRGEGGERQVDGTDIVLCHGNGGTFSSQATILLGSAATV
jgi:acetyl-CoA acetyltransferase